MSIGKRIKDLRLKQQLTQEDVAKRVGVAIQTIYKYENEIVTNIPSDRISSLAKALNTTPAYIMGWDNLPTPAVTDDYVTFPVIGEVAAGYDHIAIEDWEGDTIDIPRAWLHGRKEKEFFVLRVIGDSMFPMYHPDDKILVLKQNTMNYSGEIGVVLYDDEISTLKKVEYIQGEDWMKLVPINPSVPPITIEGERLEHCKILGIPKILVREVK